MLYFAEPIIRENALEKLQEIIKSKNFEMLRGIKACTKFLTSTASKSNKIVVCAADIQPADTVSHLPVLSEEKEVPLLFVEKMSDLKHSNSFNKETTCIVLDVDKANFKEILALMN
ncbi:hypothetical protein EDEG_00188 [Edhazardia aedis USNM 41457]|uniref:Ribosomal protein eL8/eL30/eS12/Gadd45 domain-containing protein n=1 Tax=Edhazardia aedis (strain USNM 41457) TaxID=1003232 RepID=J9DM77_EDHAE|nr:hypothetical protein EDEG_00188 [Edhazardia aedis USNM 41457]|eukprot:EJW03700.1 hypothetical protein EDEG_00188 [Edhazardia aedis USNM 41457]